LHHPAVVEQFNQRASDGQLRIADQITTEHTLLLEHTDITRLIDQLTEAIHQQVVGAKTTPSVDKQS
jgi:hypothetical protein